MGSIISEKSYIDNQLEFDFRKWKTKETVEGDKMYKDCGSVFCGCDMQIGYGRDDRICVLWSPKEKNRVKKYFMYEVIKDDKITNTFYHHMRNHIHQNVFRRRHSTPQWKKIYPELDKLDILIKD